MKCVPFRRSHPFLITLKVLVTAFFVIPCSLFAQDGNELIKAVMYQDLARIKELIQQGVNVDFQDDYSGSTALLMAANYGFTDIAKLLIESGAHLDLPDKNGSTPLMAAAAASEDLFLILLQAGADPLAKSKLGTGALTLSITGILSDRVSTAIPKLLLEKGVDINESAEEGAMAGYTCLMMAARNNRPDLAQFLVENGANINARAADGATALSLAQKENDSEMVELLKNLGAQK